MIMLADKTGEVARILVEEKQLCNLDQVSRSFGVLDTISHLAYNALFVIDSSGVVQANVSKNLMTNG